MLTEELKHLVQTTMPFPPTDEQAAVIAVFSQFITDPDPQSVMILRGCAGTGKTTVAAAIVNALKRLQAPQVLLAPTGRAAKVFSLYAHQPAYTIHRRIYRQHQNDVAPAAPFTLGFNAARDTLFIVDEASMISDDTAFIPTSPGFSMSTPRVDLQFHTSHLEFSQNSLLSDLIRFVYNAQGCRLLLIGDHAQLPPVGQTASPALVADTLRDYGLHVYEATLNEVLRQAAASGILWNATSIRASYLEGTAVSTHFVPRVTGFTDIRVLPGDELIEQLATSYSTVGIDDTVVVTRSNKRANIYNDGIRRTILDREELLCRGDRLMIVKNNYHWLPPKVPFLANGDIAIVQRVRNIHDQHGFQFADVTLSFPDYDDVELTATVLLDTLTSQSPSLTREQQNQLYQQVLADYAHIPSKTERMRQLKQDRYYNALQVKFAYAVTCHKAQGGQWQHVYIDQGYLTTDMISPEYYHWLYTAFTRATQQVFLVNWPEVQ